MCLHPRQLRRSNVLTHSSYYQPVPCGCCIECLKRKQNDYAFILSHHAKYHGKLDLLTLTYRNEAIPFSGVFEVVDPDSGEVLERSGLFWLKQEYQHVVAEDYYRDTCESGWQLEVPHGYLDGLEEFQTVLKHGTYTPEFVVPICYSPKAVFSARIGRVRDGARVRSVVSPSLRRRDVKDALKVVRIMFKRKYGYNAKFSYFEVGEYGTKHNRPHYHIVLFDCPDDFIVMFREYWYEHYGNTDYEPVQARNGDDLATCHEKIARYLSKYLCKGSFEKQFVRCGYVERPRRISSKGIAADSLPALRSYCLAYDIFGEYDPDKPPVSVLNHLDYLIERQYLTYTKNGTSFRVKIPKILYEKVLSKTYGLSTDARKDLGFSPKTDTSFVFRVSHQRSLLSRKLSAFKAFEYQKVLGFQLHRASSGNTIRPSSVLFREAFTSITGAPESFRHKNAKAVWSELRDFYNSSKDGQ